MKMTRRNWIARTTILGSGFGCFGYGTLVEKHWLDVTRKIIPLAPDHAALDGLKIAVMADFHFDDYGDKNLIRRAVNVINEEKVDLVCLPGDFISTDPASVIPLCNELGELRSRFGTYGMMGNHDRVHLTSAALKTLDRAGVRMLVNESEEFDDFAIAGIDSFCRGNPDLAGAIRSVDPGKPVILGWHEPDTFDTYADPRIALQISGHTHGGQICAPVYGPVLLPIFGKNYPYGHYQRGLNSLFVTRGIGTLTIPARFLCAPEVAILSLSA
jgi:predicted MPP superfamily phosphohydrolase